MAKITTSEVKPQTGTIPDMSAILSRLETLEAENKKLSDKLTETTENKFIKAKEHYKGPRLYSYKMWGGVPALSYESIKKDNTKDWLYKNQFGQMTSNHYLKIQLANNETVEVEVNEFNMSYTRSEKLPCEVISDGISPTGFKFKTSDFGEFIVKPNFIN